MTETDISKADTSRTILAYLKCDYHNGYLILTWDDREKGWCDDKIRYDEDSIKAWDYVFDPPEKRSELREQLIECDNQTAEGSAKPAIMKMFEIIIDKLEELDD